MDHQECRHLAGKQAGYVSGREAFSGCRLGGGRSKFGQAVTFTVTVAATVPGSGTPGGTVQFTDGTTVLSTATLSQGKATFTTSSLSVGSHAIRAVYAGNSKFNPKKSAVLTQKVNP